MLNVEMGMGIAHLPESFVGASDVENSDGSGGAADEWRGIRALAEFYNSENEDHSWSAVRRGREEPAICFVLYNCGC